MPTYDYKCLACGHEFEAFQNITSAPLKECPKCGKPELKRLIGAGAGIIFRGSGFYATDYRNGSARRKSPSDNSTGSKQSAEKSASDAGD
ncbi:MAG: zinc ribbon domain-containing protein [Planctomycetes bacterium]|nr:zinc ribbon domain-containing protein [Planctomycetota bacterium]